MFRRSHIQKVLCSEGPMFRKYLFRKSFVQMVLYSEGPICSEDPIFRNICLEDSISGRSYVEKILYSEDPLFRRSYAGNHK